MRNCEFSESISTARNSNILSRIITIFLTILLGQKSHQEEPLTCEYGTNSYHLWPAHKYCFLYNVDLTMKNQNELYSFSGDYLTRMQTKAIRFWYSAVEFLPVDIFTAFPRLNGILIGDSSIAVVRDTLFNRYFTNIEYLYLGGNKIRYIEELAFVELIRLKWINLAMNEIEYLTKRMFHNNYKLEYISFYNNKIKMIHPQFFENLTNLKFVAFSRNDCVDEGFEKDDGTLALMSFKLRDCIDSCCNIE